MTKIVYQDIEKFKKILERHGYTKYEVKEETRKYRLIEDAFEQKELFVVYIKPPIKINRGFFDELLKNEFKYYIDLTYNEEEELILTIVLDKLS